MMVRTATVLTLLACLSLRAADKKLRVYFIGNSVTDTINYKGLEELAQSRSQKMITARHMIPGAPLIWIWNHADGGFQTKPYGHYPNALKNYQWDAVSLQPFDRKLKGDEGDVETAKKFIDLMSPKSPNATIYIYARWPRMTSNGKGFKYNKNDYDPNKPGVQIDYKKVDDYGKRWVAKYTGGWDRTNETQDYFERLVEEVRKVYPKRSILMVPAGHVMYALDQMMKAGRIPGYETIYQFYKDGIHLNQYGSYLVGCTFYATLLRKSPVGLPTGRYGKLDPKIVKIIHQIVWEVVSKHPMSGVQTK